MSWWFKNNHNPSVRSRRLVRQPPQGHPWSLVLGGFFVSVLILSSLIGAQDSFQKECGKLQFRCLCGEPRCIEPELVNNRVQDCFDGSDEEGQWDPSKCAIKNNTSEDIRFKRAAISGRLKADAALLIGDNVSEQRVTGGRLFIQSGRNLATKVMSNGVEVIVRGDKTGFVGLDSTPALPSPVTPHAITLPPSTVSRQFHLVEHPDKPNTALDHLLHSIVRSATLDMISKTLLTTFTMYTTVLEGESTIIKSREEIISNVVTEKFQPSMEPSPNLKAELMTTISPDILQDFSSYLTSTLATTYTYFNTFTESSLPVILTSTETVSNVVTLPAFLDPTQDAYEVLSPSFEILYPTSSRVFETETYHTTYTFSKTILNLDTNQTSVLTTKETLTQVVVTEADVPAGISNYPAQLLTPSPPPPSASATLVTTSTFYTTYLDGSDLVTKSEIVVNSNVVPFEEGTPQMSPVFEYPTREIQKFTLSSQAKVLDSVSILATNTYYTTYTHFTTVLGEGTETEVKSRTQVVSDIVTEVIPASIDLEEMAALQSSYMSMADFPTRTIEGTRVHDSDQITKYPYWPKDEIEGIMDPEFEKPPTAIEEMKEEIHHIVNVLADTLTKTGAMDHLGISPTTHRPLYSTMDDGGTEELEFEEVTLRTPFDPDDENEGTSPLYLSTDEGIVFDTDTEKPSITHVRTPPLKSSAISLSNSVAVGEGGEDFELNSKTETELHQRTEELNSNAVVSTVGIFPDLPTRVRNPIQSHSQSNQEQKYPTGQNKYPGQIAHLEGESAIYGGLGLGDISSLVDVYFNNVYVKNKLTSVPVLSGSGVFKRKDSTESTMTKETASVAVASIQPTAASSLSHFNGLDPTQEIFDLLSELTNEDVIPPPDYYDELKEEDAFKDPDDEDLAAKIYNLSTLASTTVNRKKANSTDLKVAAISATSEMPPLADADEGSGGMAPAYDDDVDPTTPPVPEGSGDNDAIPEFPDLNNNDPNDANGEEESTGSTTTGAPGSNERFTLVKWRPHGSAEVSIKITEKPKPAVGHAHPVVAQDKRTSSRPHATKKPAKKNNAAATAMPDYDDSSEASTKVYNLFIPAKEDSEADTVELSDGLLLDDTKDDSEGGKTEEDSAETNVQRRPPGVFPSGGGSGPSAPSGTSPSGPSKSGLSLAAGPAIGSQIVTASTSGINWTPLLNLGALGLGGLGASTLTKFTPLLSSMAGYLKSGFVPGIARNDTQHYKQPYRHHRPPLPPYETHAHAQSQPMYIPMGKQKIPQTYAHFRHPVDSIPRRPIISHAADEPNFRPNHESSQNRPFENGRFPPSNNYNFKPPHDVQPDIFSQMGQGHGNQLDDSHTRLPSSNVVKVVAGNSLNALPVTVNRSPEPFHFGQKNEGQKRPPAFIRPPPRSQENSGNWQQHIILPMPPQQEHEESSASAEVPLIKVPVPTMVGAGIQKVSRPFIIPQPHVPPPSFQPVPNSPIQPSENPINFQRPQMENGNKFFNQGELPGGSANPFNRYPTPQAPRPGFGVIEKQPRPPTPPPTRIVLRESAESMEAHAHGQGQRPPAPPGYHQFSPPPTINFIPPTHHPHPNFGFHRDQFNPRPPPGPAPDLIVHSVESFEHPRPSNNYPNYNLNPAHAQELSSEVSAEDGFFRPPNYPRPNLNFGNPTPDPTPFRPMVNPNYQPRPQETQAQESGGQNSNTNTQSNEINSNFKLPATVLLPGMQSPSSPPSSSNEIPENHSKVPVLLPGLQSLPWNPSGERSQEEGNSAEGNAANLKPDYGHAQNDNAKLPQSLNPTPHFPPFQQRPSTIFIVHETYDPLPPNSNSDEKSAPNPSSYPPMHSSSEESSSKKYPQLIIKEITTTVKPALTVKVNPTFIRRPTTTPSPKKPSTTESPISTNYVEPEHGSSFSGFVISPTMQDLLNIGNDPTENDLNFGGKLRPNTNAKDKFSGSLSSVASSKKPGTIDFDKYFSGDTSFGQTFSGSEDNESIIDPVNQQIIKSPFDRQAQSSTTTTHPPNIRNNRNSTSSSTMATLSQSSEEDFLNAFTVPGDLHNPSTSEDRRWWPTTFKPVIRPFLSTRPNLPNFKPGLEVVSVSETAYGHGHVHPTTFKNILQPTTFRPNPHSGVRNPLLSRPPQSLNPGHPFRYNDEEGLEDIKIKNIEIYKNNNFKKPVQLPSRPVSQTHPVLAFIPTSLEYEDEQEPSYEEENIPRPISSSTTTAKPQIRPSQNIGPQWEEQNVNKNQIGPNQIKNQQIGPNPKPSTNSSEEVSKLIQAVANSEQNKLKTQDKGQGHPPEEEDGDDESLELVPPGYPITRLRPPPPPNYGNPNSNRPPFQHRPPPPGIPQQNQRPGPFETITNIFRRPNPNNRPNGQDFGAGNLNHRPNPQDFVGNQNNRPNPQNFEPGNQINRPNPQDFGQPGFPPNNNPPPGLRRPQPQPGATHFVRQPQPQPPRQSLHAHGPPQPAPQPPNPNLRRPEISDNFHKFQPIPLNPNAGGTSSSGSSNVNRNPRPNNILNELIRRPQQPQLPGFDRGQGQVQPAVTSPRPITIRRPTPSSSTSTSSKPTDSENDSELYSYEDEGFPAGNDISSDKLKVSSSTNPPLNSTTPRIRNENQPRPSPKPDAPQTRPKSQESGQKLNVNDQKGSAAGDSYEGEDEDEEIGGESEDENDNSLPSKVEPDASKLRPLQIGGHVLNSFRPLRPHPPRGGQKPVIPQRGTFVFERPPIPDSSEFLKPGPSPPKTEMEPPPIDSLRLKPSILELPSNGPIRFRPGRPGGQDVNLRPNLLRPDEDLLKPTLPGIKPTFHTIASVDEDNKIIATNVVAVKLSSSVPSSPSVKPTTPNAVRISPTKTQTFNPPDESDEELDPDLSSSIEEDLPSSPALNPSTATSVVEYSGGVLKTVVLTSTATNLGKDSSTSENSIKPSRTFTRTIIRTSQWEKSPSKNIQATKSSDFSTSAVVVTSTATPTGTLRPRRPIPGRPTATSASPTAAAPTKPKPPYNPFIPSRGPPSSPLAPWIRRSTTTVSPNSFKSTTIIPRDRVTLKYNRTRPSTTATTTEPHTPLATEESKDSPVSPLSSPPTIRPQLPVAGDFSSVKPTTFRPANAIVEVKDRIYGNNSIRFVVSSSSSKSPGQSTTTRTPTTTGKVKATGAPTSTLRTTTVEDDLSEEEESEESEVVQIPLLTKNGTVSVVTNGNKITPSRTPPLIVRKPQIIVSTVSSVSVKTSSSMVTRLVTHTETSTQTITETETTVVSSAGQPMTHTVMITKTLPPQTLVSTIVGTVTVVNTVEVTPTTVRTTIFSEPTKTVTSFTGSPDTTGPSRTTEKILQAGVIPTVSKPVPTKENENVSKKTKYNLVDGGCRSNCSKQGNQVCRSFGNGTRSKCVCKPGYARMKITTPCRPTFTYAMNLSVNHMEGMTFDFRDLRNEASDAYANFITVTKDALDKAFLSTDLKRQFQGAEIMKIEPTVTRLNKTSQPEPKVKVDFLVQLTVNMTEDRIKNHLIRTLKASNFSVGRTGVITTKNMSDFGVYDFNECAVADFNDCSVNADCINLRGSFLCQCQHGYKDRSKKNKPGRDCLEMAGCAECNYKGNCYPDKHGNSSCDCFRWYGGAECQINLKILLMSIIGIGAVLFVLVLLCGIIVCKRNRRSRERPGSGRFMRYRSPTSPTTLERAAIMHDSSSDGSQTPPVRMNAQNQPYTPDSLLIDQHVDKGHRRNRPGDVNLMNFSLRDVVMDQSDRSLTVVIPRAKIRPSSRGNPGPSEGLDAGGDLASNEKKLINYLDQPPYPASANKMGPPKAGHSSRQSTLQRNNESKAFRKLSLQERRISSGALVSSGTEVSARGGMRRRSTGLEPEFPFNGYEKTVSDVRSYDETTVRSYAKPLFSSGTSRTSCYSCKPPYCAYSDSAGHTMAEKDGASTVYTTQGKLFRLSQDTDSNLSSD